MSARDEILAAIRARRQPAEPHPPRWQQPAPKQPLLEHFVERAAAAAAEVKHLPAIEDISGAIADVLRARNLAASVHLPPRSMLGNINWSTAPGLTLTHEPPGPDDAAVAIAPLAIAETGTLVYPAAESRPPSWHFRPGLEIAVLAAGRVQADLESVLARIKADGVLPSTINLVTGPSRTGDIEQTLELGAHGPKELVILVVPSLPDVK